MTTLKIGSRESALAKAQAQLVIQALEAANPKLQCQLITLSTKGDQILDKPLEDVGGKGLFTKELEDALLAKTIDLAVHSFKDMPTELDPRLPIVACLPRGAAQDVLVLRRGLVIEAEVDVIGTSSNRRKLQLEKLYPGKEVRPVRGNLQTRLAKLDNGEYDALVLAAAGLQRLGLEHRITRTFTPEEMIPAACQGILAVQGRTGQYTDLLAQIHHTETELCALAERQFIRTLEGGCFAPIGAYAHMDADQLHLIGLYYNQDSNKSLVGRIADQVTAATAPALGATLAVRLRIEAD